MEIIQVQLVCRLLYESVNSCAEVKMKNRVWYVKENETKFFENLQRDDAFQVIINGKDIQKENEFIYAIAEGFHFPVYSATEGKYVEWYPTAYKYPNNQVLSWDGLSDWITDLSWIESDRIHLIIENYRFFLIEFPIEKEYIIEFFEKKVLPWWEREVVDYTVGGKSKSFSLYLID